MLRICMKCLQSMCIVNRDRHIALYEANLWRYKALNSDKALYFATFQLLYLPELHLALPNFGIKI